jgi:hypothetical protein
MRIYAACVVTLQLTTEKASGAKGHQRFLPICLPRGFVHVILEWPQKNAKNAKNEDGC